MDFKTVLTFHSYLEALPVRSLLEQEGIACYLRDEHSSTIEPFLSATTIRIQVDEEHYEQAMSILKKHGYVNKGATSQITSKKAGTRLATILLIGFVLFIVLYINYRYAKPEEEYGYDYALEKINKDKDIPPSHWCVTSVIYNGDTIDIETLQKKDSVTCEYLLFEDGNNIFLPGINSVAIKGLWGYTQGGDSIEIYDHDDMHDIYSGVYRYEITETELVLQSNTTHIVCSKP